MCTLAILAEASRRFPLVIAANRDEDPARPSLPPHVWKDRPVPLLAGRDQRAGGSWLGVNGHGLVVGLTNLWSGAPPDPAAPSRGQLLLDLLAEASVGAVERRLRRGKLPATNPWNLAAARVGETTLLASSDGSRVRDARGLQIVGNRPLGDRDARRDAGARALIQAWEGRASDDVPAIVRALQPALAWHDPDPTHSICVHRGARFGTVSSSILLLTAPLVGGELWFAPGPPCRTAFTPVSAAMAELAAAGGPPDRAPAG